MWYGIISAMPGYFGERLSPAQQQAREEWGILVEQFQGTGGSELADIVPQPVLEQSFKRLKRAFEVVPLIAEAVTVGIERIILFGSTARGDARLGSDIDIAIVRNRFFPSDGIQRIRDRLKEHGYPPENDGRNMSLNIQVQWNYLYEQKDMPPHMRPLNYEAIGAIKKEGITLWKPDTTGHTSE